MCLFPQIADVNIALEIARGGSNKFTAGSIMFIVHQISATVYKLAY
jgi:hypothetical protein